ncbi:hypothetical protein V5O48_009227 [Marasmius crinis-equi]|uniref:CFEM domain-containing protein n=1 Tax=Marasmius crinis-equi TaxID=585013 RepID=A0ABR3FBV3_9AGAR
MQFFTIATVLAALTGLASAQFPNCAAECITKADTGSCGSDNACLCRSDAFVKSTGDCFIASCKGDDLQNAFKFSQGLCVAAGVTSSSDWGTATQLQSQTQTQNSQTTTGSSTASQTATGAQSQSTGSGGNGALSLASNTGLVMLSAGLVALAL